MTKLYKRDIYSSKRIAGICIYCRIFAAINKKMIDMRILMGFLFAVTVWTANAQSMNERGVQSCRQSHGLCRQEGLQPAARTRLRREARPLGRGTLAHLQAERCLLRGTRPRKRRICTFFAPAGANSARLRLHFSFLLFILPTLSTV